LNKKICIFPNDPLISYFEKGEIKKRYFNPQNFFDEVHVISFIDKDIEEREIQTVAGDAKLKIHQIGKITINKRKDHVNNVIDIVKSINPDIIRAYNSRLEGWFAANCAKKLNIPFFLSIHTQMDHNRKIARKTNFKKYIGLKYLEKFIEPYVIQQANKITIVYKVIEPYIIKKGGKNLELLYNRIDLSQFSNGRKIESLPTPLILSVGNLIKEKNHECIIRAMKNLDAHCLIVGKGKDLGRLQKIIKDEKLEKKIQIIDSVPHKEIQNYYKSASVFALAYDPELEGLPIPVMEAMASGLPIVVPFQKEGFSDGLENSVLFSKRNPHEFHNNIKKILNNQNICRKLSINCINKSKDFDGKIIEKREAKIYTELIQKVKN
jgi:glycosyltransferase involved in cell wall biosynthesis